MAGIPFLHNIDLNKNQLLNAKLHTSGTAPSSPGEGQIWYDSTNDLVKTYDGSSWNTISGDITGVTSATTNQLTVANSGGPAPALTIVTGAIANGGSGLATADQIHTFVTAQTDTIAASTSGTAAIATAITVADESSDTTCFPLFSTAATGNLGPKSGSNLTFNSATGNLTATLLTGTLQSSVQDSIDRIFNSDLVIGAGATDAYISFMNDNAVVFKIDGDSQVELVDGIFRPATDSDVDLGQSAIRWKDAWVDSITVTGATTSGGDITLAATKALKFADDKIKIGDSGSTPGANGIQVGEAATASGAQAIAFGYDGNATGNQSIAMGYNPTASGTYSVAIGYNMTASGSGTVAIGTGETFSEANTLVTNLDMLARTGDGAILHLQTSDTTIEDGGVLGSIQFSAPLEASGTDAILTGAEIVAVAEGTFAADNNATELLFKVGASEAAATALTIASSKNAAFAADVTVGGNLTVNGTTTDIDTVNLVVEDPLIKLAKLNASADSVDIGFYGLCDPTGSQDTYTGLFRDADDEKYKLFHRLQVEPTTTVNTSGTGYAVPTLVANLEGDVTGDVTGSSGSTTGNAATATALATGRTIGMTGDVVWTSPSFDGSGNVTAVATIQANSVTLGTDTTGDYVSTITATTNGGITTTGATSGEGVAHALAVDFASGAQTITGTQYKVVTANNLSARSISATIDKDDSTFASTPYKATIQHGLITEDVIVQLFDSVTKATVYADVVRKNFAGTNSTDKVTVTFASVPTNDIEVLITSIKGANAGTVTYA